MKVKRLQDPGRCPDPRGGSVPPRPCAVASPPFNHKSANTKNRATRARFFINSIATIGGGRSRIGGQGGACAPLRGSGRMPRGFDLNCFDLSCLDIGRFDLRRPPVNTPTPPAETADCPVALPPATLTAADCRRLLCGWMRYARTLHSGE